MASSCFLPSSLSSATATGNRDLSCNFTSSAFLRSPKLLFSGKYRKSAVRRCRLRSPVAEMSADHIPKQFREENLPDGLRDNYRNAPEYLYGLTASQMQMFKTENSPVHRQAEKMKPETLSSYYNISRKGGLPTLSSLETHMSMRTAMYGRRPRGKSSPPDLASALLAGRIVYLGLPISSLVSQLIVGQFLWLDFDDPTKPIYLYINSTGTLNENMEIVGAETDAYAIADTINCTKSPVYTINMGMALGQAAMLMSLGQKGKRGLQPHAQTKLYLPKIYRSSGASTDMWIKGRELDVNAQIYIKLLARGTGKSKEEVEKDILFSKPLLPDEAIAYGVADRIVTMGDPLYEKKKDNSELLALRQARRRAVRGDGPESAPSEF